MNLTQTGRGYLLWLSVLLFVLLQLPAGRPARPPAAQAAGSSANLAFPHILGQIGGEVQLPLHLETGGHGIGSIEVTLTYDPAVLKFVEIEAGPNLSGWFLATNTPQSGHLAVSLASSEWLTQNGTVFDLRFHILADSPQVTPIGLSRAVLNEGSVSTGLTDGSVTIVASLPTATSTPTATATGTASATVTPTATATGTASATVTPTTTTTATATGTASATVTPTPTATATATGTASATVTPTPTATATATGTASATVTPTATATATPAIATVLPEEGGAVSSQMADAAIRAAFPPGAYGEPLTLTLAPISDPPGNGEQRRLGDSFALSAVDAENRPITRFDKPFTLTVTYTGSDWAELADLTWSFYYWSTTAGQWVVIPTRRVGESSFEATVDHLTDFALWELGERRLFLPAINGRQAERQEGSSQRSTEHYPISSRTSRITP